MEVPFLVTISAFLVGFLVGVTGVGGGAVMTPALILLFGIPPVAAIATDLIFAAVTKLVASVVHSRIDSIDWRVASRMWAGSIPGTILGVSVLVFLASGFISLINLGLAALLLLTAASMLTSIRISREANKKATLFGGLFIGFSVATTSVGAGALGMALLRTLIGDESPKRIVGTDVVHAIPLALIAGMSYFFAGFFDFDLLVNLLIGSIPGVILGSLLVSKINPLILRKLLAVVLLVAAGGMILKAFNLT